MSSMYSMPLVYGTEPFDSRFLPTCMYQLRPYFEVDESSSNNTNTDNADMSVTSDLPSGPLPVPDGLNPNDPATRLALEDVLSRQMMLLCRLNELEKQLQRGTPRANSPSFDSNRFVVRGRPEDIVVYFSLDHVPFALLSVLKTLAGSDGIRLVVTYHRHSSIARLDSRQVGIKEKDLRQKLELINFTNFASEVDRAEANLSVTLIATQMDSPRVEAIFQANQAPVVGEMAIVRSLAHMVSGCCRYENEEQLWSLLASDKLTDKDCIEKLGPLCVSLSESKFLFDQPKPKLLDVVLWSIAHSDSPRTLDSLLNLAWKNSVRSYVIQ